MIRVLAQADIAGDDQVRELFTNELSGQDDWRLRVVGGGTASVLLEMEGHAEEDDGFETFGYEGGEEALQLVETPTLLTGEGLDLDLLSSSDEEERGRARLSCRGGGERKRVKGLTSASGSSVMKMGYMSMSLVRCRSACRERRSG